MYYSRCPICGYKTVIRTWHEDYYCVETDEKCPICDYHKNWSYGSTEISFQGCYETYGYNISINDYYKIERRLDNERWKYRKYLLRIGKIKGKHYSKYF